MNKDFLQLRKINNRYLKFIDKSEYQGSIRENSYNFNKSKLIKSNDVYKSNYFSVNKMGIFKNNMNNYNNIKKENNYKLNSLK